LSWIAAAVVLLAVSGAGLIMFKSEIGGLL